MRRILIDSHKQYVRAAVAEDTELIEIVIEDKESLSSVGNIYIGIVQNILPSQFAFVDIGIGRNVFLHLSDAKEAHLYDEKGKLKIKRGDHIPVQVMKDANGTKAEHVTTQISFTGGYVVLIKNDFAQKEIGISKKITDQKERDRLKKIAKKLLPKNYGLIMRTSCEGKSEEELETECKHLLAISESIIEKGHYVKPPAAMYKESSIAVKLAKELFRAGISEMIVNDQDEYRAIESAMSVFLDEHQCMLKCYEAEEAIFKRYFIESQIAELVNQKVWLKSGAFLMIEQTEACVVIDVNTGKFAGKGNHDQTVQKVNAEAVAEIAKQIQLRNLSGIIIVDLIDMKGEQNYAELSKLMQDELNKARQRAVVVGITELGLMQITRKKTREPIARMLTRRCRCCKGKGFEPYVLT